MDPVKPSAMLTEDVQQFALQVQPSLLPYLSAAKVVLQDATTEEEKNRKEPIKVAQRGVPFLLRNLFHFRNDPSKN